MRLNEMNGAGDLAGVDTLLGSIEKNHKIGEQKYGVEYWKDSIVGGLLDKPEELVNRLYTETVKDGRQMTALEFCTVLDFLRLYIPIECEDGVKAFFVDAVSNHLVDTADVLSDDFYFDTFMKFSNHWF